MEIELADTLHRLRLSDPRPLGESPIAKVWAVLKADGTPAVLKLYMRADRANEGPGVALLSAWADRGAVRVLVDDGPVLLLEHLDGPLLGDIARSGEDTRAAELLAQTAAQLHQRPAPPVPGLPPLEVITEPLFSLERGAACDDAQWQDIQRAQELARELLDSQPAQVPLHGDLHHDNVILTENGPRIIDAKGYFGDPAFEMANALRNPRGLPNLVRDPQRLRRCLALYAEAMSVDSTRLTAWVAVKCALSITWRAKGRIANDKEKDLLALFLREAGQ
ncbi:aminoglycoside phosphotransferase family protein [Ruegeria sp. 2205SS24-7]|uniref:aminoglycoside phosphotransferase family protein n=1 Tax=Ruegeria discodermiae TaxID=3064389 RepID=UPI0027409673|nr:aminoglycoside phosphotransferase family protein [Ruegeria sp. 2205SS24-7]MDP5215992.1 aminoglycoside phosphotransferase family protein [Ruegeria sp. 2205SS24-7]